MSTVLAPAVLVQCSYILVVVVVSGFVVTVEQRFPTPILEQTLTKVHQLSLVHLLGERFLPYSLDSQLLQFK